MRIPRIGAISGEFGLDHPNPGYLPIGNTKGDHRLVIALRSEFDYASTLRFGPVYQFFTDVFHQIHNTMSVPMVRIGA